VTLGRGAHASNLLFSEEALAARGFEVARTDRGGDVTVHAPGQLVGYPILDLKPDRCDVRRYVNDLAETMRRVALRHGVSAGVVPGLIGLWVDRASVNAWPGAERAAEIAKIGAIGVRISQWVTMHGFALNFEDNAEAFGVIVPCGIRNHGVTSVKELTGKSADLRAEAVNAFTALCEVLGRTEGDFDDLRDDAVLVPDPAPASV
jgi:lipoyl(octanoyl) transferase